MANEYLKRTPTSTGNRRVFTLSLWFKYTNIGADTIWFLAANPSKDNTTQIFYSPNVGTIFFFDRAGSDPTTEQVGWAYNFRDCGSWYNMLIHVDTTKSNPSDRAKCFINGKELQRDESKSLVNNSVNTNTPPQNQEFWRLNYANNIHYIGARIDVNFDTVVDAIFSDYFFVDGQALTPDVFGKYDEGKGYISAGTTQATDFKKGQWIPKTPAIIKSVINARGGFGVNGFYLPMNDSSNFGADFHTTPNSIITLKGENLPQPRNGAPTTTDAYVSQLREDPYAANLVLAVPGISTYKGPELITNGTFESGTSGWTLGTATGTLSVVDGEFYIQYASTNGAYAYQAITTEVGKSYSFTVTMRTTTSGQIAKFNVGTSINGNQLTARVENPNTTNQIFSGSFVATSTTTYITLGANYTSNAYFDNVSVREEAIPRDYSADIKGSGTNKTLVVNGGAGIADIPSYYGSALSFDGSGDYLSQTYNADFNFGTDDFTVEMWVYPNTVSSIDGLFAVSGGSGGVPKMAFHLNSGTPSVHYNGLTGASDIYTTSGTSIPAGQWSHLAYTRKGTTWTWYINGVSTGTGSNSTVITFTSQPYYIGYGGEGYFDSFEGKIQDLRVYKGVAKYKGGFDVPKPYTPINFANWRAVPDTIANNFATLNHLASRNILSNGNLTATYDNTVPYNGAISNFMMKSGKWYCEVRFDEESTGNIAVGVHNLRDMRYIYGGQSPYFFGGQNGSTLDFDFNNGVRDSPAANDGDIIQMKLDLDSSPVVFSVAVNGGAYTDFQSGVNSGYNFLKEGESYGFVAADVQSGVTGIQATVNFGQNPTFSGNTTAGTFTDSNGKGLFKYEPPSGFLALCEDNLPTPAIQNPGEHFKTILWTGDGAAGRSITGVGFQPDFVWIKERNSTSWHELFNSVVGPILKLNSNTTNAESANTNALTSFDSDGFSLGSGGAVNESSSFNYVAWCWKAGGPAVTNTAGTITSQVSVNQDAGFSIVSWTGNGVNGATLGHGLGKRPKMIITKRRDTSQPWYVWTDMTTQSVVNNGLTLNLTDGAVPFSFGHFTSLNESTATLTQGSSGISNHNTSGATYITYTWAEIEGFSKFGSYVGNDSTDGPFVYCGFKPAFVLLKASSTTANWCMIDNARNPTNPTYYFTIANAANAGDDTGGLIDFVSNGFKLRLQSPNFNGNGVTYIFAAFAESPLQTANAK